MKTFHFLSLKLVSFFFQFKQAVKQARRGQLGRLLVESRWQLPVYQCFNLILSPQFTLSLWWKQVKLLQQVKHLPSNEDFSKEIFCNVKYWNTIGTLLWHSSHAIVTLSVITLSEVCPSRRSCCIHFINYFHRRNLSCPGNFPPICFDWRVWRTGSYSRRIEGNSWLCGVYKDINHPDITQLPLDTGYTLLWRNSTPDFLYWLPARPCLPPSFVVLNVFQHVLKSPK